MAQQLDEHDMTELYDLRWHWDDAYVIDWDWRAGQFTATRKGIPAVKLTDGTTEGLRNKIRTDYAAWKDSAPRCST